MTQLDHLARAPNLSRLDEGFEALRKDLIHEDGPRISTMRNYRFAILQYDPRLEFACRARVQRLSIDLERSGWVVFTISLEKLLFDRIRAEGPEFVERVARRETTSWQGQHEGKAAALSRNAVQMQGRAHALKDGLADRQPKTDTLLRRASA